MVAELPGKFPVCFTQVKVTGASPVYFTLVTNHRHLQELHRLPAFQQVTTKVPPSYDGRGSWFAYEDAIDDWCDITELDNDIMTREDARCETV